MYTRIPKNSIEIKSKRTYNSKSFLVDGKEVVNLHLAPLHYENKLGLGDGEKGLRETDLTLNWNEKKRGWYFKYHNFHPFLPEYADEWVSFRDLYKEKDQTIRYKAICNHVKGRLVKQEYLEKEGLIKLTGVNLVIYDNAFGDGIDYILYFGRNNLKKIVRIREHSVVHEDMLFDFEIDLPKDTKVIRAKASDNLDNSYELDLTKDKEFDTNKKLLIGNSNKKERGAHTYINPLKVWDSKDSRIINWKYYIKNGKKYIQKIIPKYFLEKSDGDVYTDATSDYYETKDSSYGTVYNQSGQGDSTSLNFGGWYDYYYDFLEWDLNDTPLSSETLNCEFYIYSNGAPTNDPEIDIRVIKESWDESTLSSADNPTSTVFDRVRMEKPSSGYMSTDITYIYKKWKAGNYTNYGIKLSPNNNDETNGSFRSEDYAGITSDPYLAITKGYRAINNKFQIDSVYNALSLDNSSKQFIYRFTADRSDDVTNILVYLKSVGGPNAWNVGIKADSGGLPTGSYLSSGGISTAPDATGWYTATMSSPISLTEGNIYHIVISYDSGTVDASNYIQGRMTYPNNYLVPYGVSDDLEQYTYYSTNGGSSYYAYSPYQPVFLLSFGGDYYGNPFYTYSSVGAYGTYWRSEKLTTSSASIIKNIGAYVYKNSATNPSDDLYYEIRNSSETVLRSGTLVSSSSVSETATWYESELSSPLELSASSQYRFVFKSPNSDSSYYYYIRRTLCTNTSDHNAVTFGGTTNTYNASVNSGVDWTPYNSLDIMFYADSETTTENLRHSDIINISEGITSDGQLGETSINDNPSVSENIQIEQIELEDLEINIGGTIWGPYIY